MSEQLILTAEKNYAELDIFLQEKRCKRILLVSGRSLQYFHIREYFKTLEERLGIKVVRFDHFIPNPLYESVVEGVALFSREKCDAIIAVGGGSAMDVAKCIKLFAAMNPAENYLKQKMVPNDIPFLVCPTTAGTGSEATKYAVIYYKGEKQSITEESCIPQAVLFDPAMLDSLPEYQRKSTFLDAFCHAIESYWSIHSDECSKQFARDAIKIIMEYRTSYLANEKIGNEKMLKAANLAGKAINITQTTAGHAMSYKLTSLYGIAHGHAAALCVNSLFPYMLEHIEGCIDKRGKEYLRQVFQEIADAMGCITPQDAAKVFSSILYELNLKMPIIEEGDYELLKSSVNPIRLRNHPIKLGEQDLEDLYHQFCDIC